MRAIHGRSWTLRESGLDKSLTLLAVFEGISHCCFQGNENIVGVDRSISHLRESTTLSRSNWSHRGNGGNRGHWGHGRIGSVGFAD